MFPVGRPLMLKNLIGVLPSSLKKKKKNGAEAHGPGYPVKVINNEPQI